MTQPENAPMLAELVPPRLLPKVLTRFDLVTIYFALIFGSYGAAQMAAKGWAGIPMLTLAAVTFLVPCALASYELGTLFPGEGGIYIWAHKTLGPAHGFVAGWLSWVPIFLLLPLGASTIAAHLQVALGQSWPLWAQVACQVGVVCVVTAISLARLVFSQRFVRWLFFVSFGTAVAVVLAGLFGHARGTPVDREIVSLDLSRYGSLYSAAILWLLGVEVPFNMGAEFGDHRRTAGTMLLWGSVALLVGYYLGIVGVLLTTPVEAIDATTGVARGAGRVAPWLGSAVALAISAAVLSQDVTYMNAYSRLLFISGVERRLPAVMGQVTERSRVPVPALLVQALGAIVVILIFASQAQLAVAFNLYIAALIVVWCAALFYLYVGVVRARRMFAAEYEERRAEVWRIPGGRAGLWFAAAWGALFNAVAIYYVFAIPLTSDIPASRWRLWLTAISAVVALSGFAIYAMSQRTVAALNAEDELKKYARFDAQGGKGPNVSLLWRYVLLHALRRPRRFALTGLGLAASFAAVFFAYGLSGWVEARSSRNLAAILGDANVWVVGGATPGLDAASGGILPRALPPADTLDALRRLPGGGGLSRVAVSRITVEGRPAVLYADERERAHGLLLGPDLWRQLGPRHEVPLGPSLFVVREARRALPPGIVVTSFELGRHIRPGDVETAWLVGRVERPAAWALRASVLPGVVVRDGPAEVPGARAVVHVLEGSASRFDPFSFRTKFSALTLGASMGTLFGVLARGVFLFGVVLACSSAGIGLRERRAELAVFAVNGLESGVTVLLLLDALLLNLVAAALGALLAAGMLSICLPTVEDPAVFGHMLGIGAAYVPLLVLVSTLIPAQLVATRHPGRLARGGA